MEIRAASWNLENAHGTCLAGTEPKVDTKWKCLGLKHVLFLGRIEGFATKWISMAGLGILKQVIHLNCKQMRTHVCRHAFNIYTLSVRRQERKRSQHYLPRTLFLLLLLLRTIKQMRPKTKRKMSPGGQLKPNNGISTAINIAFGVPSWMAIEEQYEHGLEPKDNSMATGQLINRSVDVGRFSVRNN